MKKDITNPNICEVVTHDILEEILVHLPVKSLSRFKSVSKQWKSMIESSYLAKKRLVRYPNPKLFVLRSETSRDQSSGTILLETISEDHHHKNKILIRSYKVPDYDDHVGRIMGYCNGLVCIYHLGYIYIINPTTRKLRTLSPDFLRNCTCLLGWLKLPINVGFGRDIVTGTYKVVLMYFFDRIGIYSLVKTEVLNLKNGERRCICFPINYGQLSNDKTSIFANGSLYWLNTNLRITALDLHTEMFSEILPPSSYTGYSNTVYVWSLNDRLCLSDVIQYPNVDVWGWQQEGPSVKWEKIHSITILSLNCLDVNYWKLGLAACYFRPIEKKPSKNLLEQVPEDHCSTALCAENLVSLV